MMHQIGKYLMIGGVILAVVGLILFFLGNKFSWFGNLPGDIKIKRDDFVFYAPIASMLLISAVLSFLLWLFSKIKF
jgi:magnesium-transporting ATPase (P-type)